MTDLKGFLWVRIEELIDAKLHRDDDSPTEAAVTMSNHKWSISLSNPLRQSPEDTERLNWYFEKRYRIPEAEPIRAKVAERNIAEYGADLFTQIFSASSCPIELQEDEKQALAFQIIGNNVQMLLWETIRASVSHEPFATTTTVIRQSPMENQLQDLMIPPEAKEAINVLLVLSRPYWENDVASDIISRPLYEILSTAGMSRHYKLDIVRPGSFTALKDHLRQTEDSFGKHFYDIIHFDVHGTLITYDQLQQFFPFAATDTNVIDAQISQTGQQEIESSHHDGFSGSRPFLLFSSSPGQERHVHPVNADTIAQLLKQHEISVAIFNSCESSKEEAGSEASLARVLSQKACKSVIGMSFSITATGATIFMKSLYQNLILGMEMGIAASKARNALYSQRERFSGAKTFEAQDWMLPVVFSANQISSSCFPPLRSAVSFDPGSDATSPDNSEKGVSDNAAFTIPDLHGRNIDILAIEEKLLANGGIVLVNGAAGVGKSSLLGYLAWWWKCTNFIADYFVFDFRESTVSVDVIHSTLRRKGLIPGNSVLKSGSEERVLEIVESLSQANYLIIIDSLERAAEVLSRDDTSALRKLLNNLHQSKPFVVLATQGLQPSNIIARAYEKFTHHLGGLDESGTEMLVSRIISSLPQERRPTDEKGIVKLVQQLDGNPLALEVVLSSLATKSVSELIMNLSAASQDAAPNLQMLYGRLYSPIKSFYLSLSDSRQLLLLCLAPFSLHMDRVSLGRLGNVLKKHKRLEDVAVEQLGRLIDHMHAAGLAKVTTQHLGGRLMLMHPLLTTFLRDRLSLMDAEFQEAVNVCCLQNFATEAEQLLIERSHASSDDERYLVSLIIDFQFEYLFGTLRALIVEFHKSGRNITTLLCNNFYRQDKMSECYNVASTVLNLYAEVANAEVAFRVDIVVAYYWACVAASGLNWMDELQEMFRRVKHFWEQEHSKTLEVIADSQRNIGEMKTMGLIYLELLVLMGSNALKAKETSSSREYFEKAKVIRSEIQPTSSDNNSSLLGEYFRNGQLCMNEGRTEEAALLLSQAITIYDEDPKLVAFDDAWTSIVLLAEVEKQLGELEKAKELYQRALAMLPEDPSKQIKNTFALIHISTVEGLLGDHVQSAETGRLALMSLNRYKITQPTQQIHEIHLYRATAYHNIGISMADGGLTEEARGMFMDALKEKQLGGLSAEMAISYQALGSLNQNDGMFVEAAQNYKKALEHAAGGNTQRDTQRYVFKSLGYLMLDVHDAPKSRSFLERSLEDIPALTKLRSGDHLVTKATIEETLENLAVAKRFLEDAVDKLASLQIPSDLAKWSEVQIRLARLSLCREDYPEAFTRYWKGLKALVQIPEYQDIPAASTPSTIRLFDLTFFDQESSEYTRILESLHTVTIDVNELVLEHRPHRFHAVSTYNLGRLLMDCEEWRIAAIILCAATKMWNIGGVFETSKDLIDAWATAKTKDPESTESLADFTLCKSLAPRICGHLTDPSDHTALRETLQEINSVLVDV